MKPSLSCLSLCALLLAGAPHQVVGAQAADAETTAAPAARGKKPRIADARTLLPDEVRALQRLSVILGRPDADRVTANVLSAEPLELQIEYGSQTREPLRRTALVQLAAAEPQELELTGLQPASPQVYRLRWRRPGEPDFRSEAWQRFHTQRAPGQAFSFALQGDSHPERGHQFDPALYAQTLSAARNAQPDFYLTLGDDFSVDTLKTLNRETVSERYRFQRPFLALVGQTAPLFLVNGNHEQASAANLDGTPENVAVWAQTARNRFFSLPEPGGIYSGNPTPLPHIGLVRDYYAWTWGDALFVVIDPYWHSPRVVDNALGSRDKRGRDLWNNTLGEAQYRWLRQTLESSQARYKFVFAHHVLGTGRGGVQMARQYEWGGQEKNGRNRFAEMRPGWPEPIHALMARTGVTIFFQGHDHVFAKESLDGVIYQTVPEPADPNYALYFAEAYPSADLRPNSGHLQVHVSPERVRVEYHRTWLPKDLAAAETEAMPAVHYEIRPRR